MEQIQTYTYPQGQQLSDGELVQIQVTRNGRLVFEDAYFQELQDGDIYIIPEQAKLPPATDAEILDYMVDHDLSYTTLSDRVIIWEKATLSDVVSHDFDPKATDVRSAFREAMTQVIHNAEL